MLSERENSRLKSVLHDAALEHIRNCIGWRMVKHLALLMRVASKVHAEHPTEVSNAMSAAFEDPQTASVAISRFWGRWYIIGSWEKPFSERAAGISWVSLNNDEMFGWRLPLE